MAQEIEDKRKFECTFTPTVYKVKKPQFMHVRKRSMGEQQEYVNTNLYKIKTQQPIRARESIEFEK